jgi:uncharacterized protein YndB with AHSA1/START domain
MRLESTIVIHRQPADVWAYLSDPANIARWDRGVGRTEPRSTGAMGVGGEFDTLGRGTPDQAERARMSYQIAAASDDSCTIDLTSRGGNARFFRSARWIFRVVPDRDGSRLTCTVDFVLRRRYLIFAPLLFAMRSALGRDLRALRDELTKD